MIEDKLLGIEDRPEEIFESFFGFIGLIDMREGHLLLLRSGWPGEGGEVDVIHDLFVRLAFLHETTQTALVVSDARRNR